MAKEVKKGTPLDEFDRLLERMTNQEVALAWARCMKELKDRDLVRTSNNPVGDYAERVVCEMYGYERKDFSEKSIDAVGKDGTRYQIKGRRLTAHNKSRQLGAIREITEDPFDVLLAVFFDEELNLSEIWSIPKEVVAEAAFVERTNSTRFVLTKTRMKDRRVVQLFPPPERPEEAPSRKG